ncbi:hypothetical protein JZ751_006055 [Albula glossodonta]|uniref:LIM domain-binding protein 2 n=1 Tax=Albula glossodonta TaxID=121402 RepID=A0A8T2PCA2_9TELE|nr:hypothetical protein JZ751_006055 [Albula glossodonta]
MVTQHGKPMFTKVCTEGRLILEFAFDDLMRIKTWHFTIRQYRELIPRSIVAMHAQDSQVLEQLSKNITRMGLTNFTLNYLRLCVILEPMQELMSRHKTYNLSPRDCLKTCLFQKWQRMVAPPAEPTRQTTTKRRKRKNSASSASNSSMGNNANSKKRSPAGNFSLSSQSGERRRLLLFPLRIWLSERGPVAGGDGHHCPCLDQPRLSPYVLYSRRCLKLYFRRRVHAYVITITMQVFVGGWGELNHIFNSDLYCAGHLGGLWAFTESTRMINALSNIKENKFPLAETPAPVCLATKRMQPCQHRSPPGHPVQH